MVTNARKNLKKKELKGTTSHYDSDQCIVILDTCTDASSDLDHTITVLKSAAKEWFRGEAG